MGLIKTINTNYFSSKYFPCAFPREYCCLPQISIDNEDFYRMTKFGMASTDKTNLHTFPMYVRVCLRNMTSGTRWDIGGHAQWICTVEIHIDSRVGCFQKVHSFSIWNSLLENHLEISILYHIEIKQNTKKRENNKYDWPFGPCRYCMNNALIPCECVRQKQMQAVSNWSRVSCARSKNLSLVNSRDFFLIIDYIFFFSWYKYRAQRTEFFFVPFSID